MKKLFGLMMAFVLMFGLVACGNSTPSTTAAMKDVAETTVADSNSTEAPAETPASEEFKVDVFIYNFADTYIGTVRDALESQLKNISNVKYTFHDAANAQDVQNTQIDGAIANGSNLLVVNIVETESANVVIEKANTAGIPVVFFNREISNDAISAYDMSCFVGTDPDQAGYMQGEMVATLLLKDDNYEKADLNKDGKISYVMLRADLDNPEANGRTKYSVEEANRLLTEAGKPELVQIGSDYVASWDTAKAKEGFDAFLTSNPFDGDQPIELVFANNDDMALGAIQSLNSAGYNNEGDKNIIVVGVDATATAIDAIQKGRMQGSVKQDGEAMATCIAEIVNNVSMKKDFLEGTNYKFEDAARKVRIPYSMFTNN